MVDQSILGANDLARRWRISRQRVHKLAKDGLIPEGTVLTSTGLRRRVRVWTLAEIEAHEATHPERRPEQHA